MFEHDVYVSASKDALWDDAVRLGLSEEASLMFRHLATEVRLTYRVDRETGIGVLIAVDGRALHQS